MFRERHVWNTFFFCRHYKRKENILSVSVPGIWRPAHRSGRSWPEPRSEDPVRRLRRDELWGQRDLLRDRQTELSLTLSAVRPVHRGNFSLNTFAFKYPKIVRSWDPEWLSQVSQSSGHNVCPGQRYEAQLSIQFTAGQESLEFVDVIVVTGTSGFVSSGLKLNITPQSRQDISRWWWSCQLCEDHYPGVCWAR